MATLCAQPRCVFFRDLGATPEATEGPSGVHRLRLRGGNAELKLRSTLQQSAGLVVF